MISPRKLVTTALVFVLSTPFACADVAKSPAAIAEKPASAESGANTVEVPVQILRTGVTLNTLQISPNSQQLSDNIGLTPVLAKIQSYRMRLKTEAGSMSQLDRIELRQDLHDSVQDSILIIQRTMLEIDFCLSEISAEDEVYQEILSAFAAKRDKFLAALNAANFISNGSLWAISESLAIPTWKRPKYSISSGTVSILAGIVPSMFALYTLKAVNGQRKTSEAEPNMLAKLFEYPINPEIDYPPSVWRFLMQAPATGGRPRVDQLIDRWVADSNISGFTDRKSRAQLDAITASIPRKKALSIATLTARSVMLEQLAAEIFKMKKMLLELDMAILGEKQV